MEAAPDAPLPRALVSSRPPDAIGNLIVDSAPMTHREDADHASVPIHLVH